MKPIDAIFEPLDANHAVKKFACAKQDFTRFLHKHALGNATNGLGVTVVAVRPADRAILGYYTLCSASVARSDLPTAEHARLPPYPHMPGVLLAKLAVHAEIASRGLGKRLLMLAMRDALAGARFVGWRFFMIDAYDADALAYYEHLQLGLVPMPGMPKRLYLPIETVRQAVETETHPGPI